MVSVGQCAICFGGLCSSQAYALTKCGHTFHKLCAEKWIKQARTCPSCRVRATNGELIKLYFHERNTEDKGFEIADPEKMMAMELRLNEAREMLNEVTVEKERLAKENLAFERQVYFQRKECSEAQALVAKNRSLENSVSNYRQMEEELYHVKACLKASKFYDLLSKKTRDDSEIMKYIQPDGNISEPQFLYMLEDRALQAEHSQKVAVQELEDLKKKLIAEQNHINDLKKEVQELRNARIKPSTPYPVSKEVNYAPRIINHSMGFGNETSQKVYPESGSSQKRPRGQQFSNVPSKKYIEDTIILIN